MTLSGCSCISFNWTSHFNKCFAYKSPVMKLWYNNILFVYILGIKMCATIKMKWENTEIVETKNDERLMFPSVERYSLPQKGVYYITFRIIDFPFKYFHTLNPEVNWFPQPSLYFWHSLLKNRNYPPGTLYYTNIHSVIP